MEQTCISQYSSRIEPISVYDKYLRCNVDSKGNRLHIYRENGLVSLTIGSSERNIAQLRLGYMGYECVYYKEAHIDEHIYTIDGVKYNGICAHAVENLPSNVPIVMKLVGARATYIITSDEARKSAVYRNIRNYELQCFIPLVAYTKIARKRGGV